MPYPHSLSSYVLPEFEAEAPASWEARLREISPVASHTSHLRFRKFAPREDWKESPFNAQPDRPLWAIYTCLPIRLVEPLTAAGFTKHWSEESTVGEKVATRAMVSDYMHFMWHTSQLYVKPFLLLQGDWGGTPMSYTRRERRYLAASGADTTPAPPGCFTPCPFDERVVRNVLARDRLIQAGNRLDELEKQSGSAAKKAEDEAAEAVYREAVLQHLTELAAPAAEFMKSQLGKREIDAAVAAGDMRPAPADLPDTLATWRDHFRATGQMPTATAPRQRNVQKAVA